MSHKFLIKSFVDQLKKSSQHELKYILAELFSTLFHEAEMETLARHRLILQAVVIEIDSELKALNDASIHNLTDEMRLACDVGTNLLTVLKQSVEHAIDCTVYE